LRDSGALLPGFNDDYKGAGPDLGAFEFGALPLEFGRRAYLKYNEDGLHGNFIKPDIGCIRKLYCFSFTIPK
jgi:hypothetical protein